MENWKSAEEVITGYCGSSRKKERESGRKGWVGHSVLHVLGPGSGLLHLLVTLDQSFDLSASQFPICKMEIALSVLSTKQLVIFADHIETEYRNAFGTWEVLPGTLGVDLQTAGSRNFDLVTNRAASPGAHWMTVYCILGDLATSSLPLSLAAFCGMLLLKRRTKKLIRDKMGLGERVSAFVFFFFDSFNFSALYFFFLINLTPFIAIPHFTVLCFSELYRYMFFFFFPC